MSTSCTILTDRVICLGQSCGIVMLSHLPKIMGSTKLCLLTCTMFYQSSTELWNQNQMMLFDSCNAASTFHRFIGPIPNDAIWFVQCCVNLPPFGACNAASTFHRFMGPILIYVILFVQCCVNLPQIYGFIGPISNYAIWFVQCCVNLE